MAKIIRGRRLSLARSPGATLAGVMPPGREVSARRFGWVRCLLLVAAAAWPAHAQGPVSHEFFEANPQEDLLFRATTASGTMPAAIDTPGGVVRAPDAFRDATSNEVVYGSSTPNSTDASYRIDRNTSRPDVVRYDDPFVPAITPFKRLYAYDAVDDGLELAVRRRTLEPIPKGGEVGADEDRFYADMVVDLGKNEPVRIPSVGPGARVVATHTNPVVKFELLRDGAENWFIRAPEHKRVRLVMMLAIPRAVFGSEFADVSWSALASLATGLPSSVRAAAREVAGEIGVTTTMKPKDAVARLVAHFRAFAPSDDPPKAESGVALYRELALSQKGVCRHRAYAFVITALELGIPARLVRNEAHAWVEVFDGKIWHLVDLGGAAGRLDYQEQPDTQMYRAPADPFRWPEGSESAQQMAERSMSSVSGDPAAGTAAPSSSASADPMSVPSASEPLGLGADAGPPVEDSRPTAKLALLLRAVDARRGGALAVSGRVDADGEACQYARVDVALKSAKGKTIPIGAVPAGADGKFEGAVTVPLDVDVGEYDLVVSTPGDARCGPGQSE